MDVEEEKIEGDYLMRFENLHSASVFSVCKVKQENLVFVSGDQNNTCVVWRVSIADYSATVIQTLEGHTDTVDLIESNGKLVVTGGMQNTLKIWKIKDDCLELVSNVSEGPETNSDVNSVSWHPKGNALLAGGEDKQVWVLNGANGSYVGCLSGHKQAVVFAKFSDSGKHIVSACHE